MIRIHDGYLFGVPSSFVLDPPPAVPNPGGLQCLACDEGEVFILGTHDLDQARAFGRRLMHDQDWEPEAYELLATAPAFEWRVPIELPCRHLELRSGTASTEGARPALRWAW